MEIIEKPNEEFNLVKLNTIYENETKYNVKYDEKTGKKIKNNECKKSIEYLKKYLFQIDNGDYYFYSYYDKSFKYYNITELNNLYLNKLNKDLRNEFIKSVVDIFRVIGDNTTPEIYKLNEYYFINIAPRMKFYGTTKKYDDFNNETKNNVKVIVDFIKEFIGHRNIKDYEYFMKYLKMLCLGKKVDVAPILKGVKRIGRHRPKNNPNDG
jgi:hypothetical protein